MPAQKTIKVALVGAGAAGQAHAFGYRNVSMAAGLESIRIDLAVVVDPNVELARRTADRYGYAEATADVRRVLDDPSIDAISVALPNSVHARGTPRDPAIRQACPHRKTARAQRRRGRRTRCTGRTVNRGHRRRVLLSPPARTGRGPRSVGRERDWQGAQLHRVVQRRLRGLARGTVQLAVREGHRGGGCADRHRHPRNRCRAIRHRPGQRRSSRRHCAR